MCRGYEAAGLVVVVLLAPPPPEATAQARAVFTIGDAGPDQVPFSPDTPAPRAIRHLGISRPAARWGPA